MATISFTGDMFFGQEDAGVSEDLASLMRQSDAVIVNLEGPLTRNGEPLPSKKLHLRSNAGNISILKAISTTVAVTANNHILDWGQLGLRDTLTLLRENDILALGAGLNSAEAEKPVVLRVKGLLIGLIAYSAPEIQTVQASENSAGCNIVDESRMCLTIQHLCAEVDHVIVVVHWGATNYHYPLPQHTSLGRKLIDAGASAVVGHHPHVIQGYEEYKGSVILYSLGNFLFGSFLRGGNPVAHSKENRNAIVATLSLAPDRVTDLTITHTAQRKHETFVEKLAPDASKRRDRFLNKLSRPLGRPGYNRLFKRYVLKRFVYRCLRWLNPRMWKNLDRAYLMGLQMVWKRLRA